MRPTASSNKSQSMLDKMEAEEEQTCELLTEEGR